MKELKSLWHFHYDRIRICFAVSFLVLAAVTVYSFVSFWKSAHNEAYRFIRTAGTEIISRLESYLEGYDETIRRAGYSIPVQHFLLSDNPDQVIFSSSAASENIINTFTVAQGCRNIYLAAENRRYLCANRNYINEIRWVIGEHQLTENPRKSAYYCVSPDGDEMSLLFYVVPVYNIILPGWPSSDFCVIVCDLDDITGLSTVAGTGRQGAAVLMFDGNIISKSRSLSAVEIEVINEAEEGRNNISTDGERYISEKLFLPKQRWSFAYVISERIIMNNVFVLMKNSLLYLGVSVLLIAAILALIMQFVEQKQRLIDAVTAQAQAEFLNYRSQINPHFFFNSLESMRSMAHSSRNKKLETMISSMSKMFRYSLYAKAQVSLSQELEHIANYIQVMNIRFPERYKLMIKAEECALNRLILSMILQPLVENSIHHGFAEDSPRGALILIRAYCRPADNFLIVQVTDNGAGMTENEIVSLDQARGALYNISRRMRLCFGAGFRIALCSKKRHYTQVTLEIPPEMELVLPDIKGDAG